MQQHHDLETDEECAKLLRGRLVRLLQRVSEGKYLPKFNDVDILAAELLVSNRLVVGAQAKSLVDALREWSEERKRVRKKMPYQDFAASLQHLIYELEDKDAFLKYANGDLFKSIQDHEDPREFSKQMLAMYRRLVPVAQGDGDMESFVGS